MCHISKENLTEKLKSHYYKAQVSQSKTIICRLSPVKKQHSLDLHNGLRIIAIFYFMKMDKTMIVTKYNLSKCPNRWFWPANSMLSTGQNTQQIGTVPSTQVETMTGKNCIYTIGKWNWK